MNLSQLIQAVYTETNRPDLVNETLQAVLEATQTVHQADNFQFDATVGMMAFTAAGYLQTIDLTQVPNFRSCNFLRKTDLNYAAYEANPYQVLPTLTPPTTYDFLKPVSISDLIDEYGYERTDIWWQAGTSINIKSSTSLQYVTFGYYTNPVLDATGVLYSSWVATNQPYAIIYRASGVIFAKIGEDKSAAMYLRPPGSGMMDEGGLYFTEMAKIRRSQITAAAW